MRTEKYILTKGAAHMKLDKLIGERFKEKPSDCVIDSHALMLRGGYMKNVANGIFSQYPPLKRITQKIEQIIREEMDAIDGQEVMFPVIMPASLWEESGRYASVGNELIRFKDRSGSPMVLGMTHEEAAVHLVREYGQSYTRYPFMIYQIQTKCRDEARPRGGLIRVREFTMKDAYSFHTSQEDLEEYFKACYKAYERIFARCGIPETVVVSSDSGMMGGKVSYEYMLLTEIGEDSLAICYNCDYKANLEAAESIFENENKLPVSDLKKARTPDITSIEDVCAFLGYPAENSCKAVVYQKNADDGYVVVFIRGDLDINEVKLTNYLKEAVHPADIKEESGLCAGFIGPCGLDAGRGKCSDGKESITVLFDRSLQGLSNLVCGANEKDFHYTGFDFDRDCGDEKRDYLDLSKVKDGFICPKCGKPEIKISRGVEIGHIFQLGDKYTKPMNMQYLDKDGNSQYPIMGCYGIGVGRAAATVCEVRRDDYGPIWPVTIAPWQVHLCCLRPDDAETKAFADNLYDSMKNEGIEVIYDDRNVRAGVMFSDADLLGVPVRVIVSPKAISEASFEIVTRDKSVNIKVTADEIMPAVRGIIRDLTEEIEGKVLG